MLHVGGKPNDLQAMNWNGGFFSVIETSIVNAVIYGPDGLNHSGSLPITGVTVSLSSLWKESI